MPEHDRFKIFLDANVLISACLSSESDFRDLWNMRHVEVVTSRYALEEAQRHLDIDQQARLNSFIARTQVCAEPSKSMIPSGVVIIEKDQPILSSAISSGATYLLTGDKRHFGSYYGKLIASVRIIKPGDFLSYFRDRVIL